MLIGMPKETKVHAYRVGLLPAAVHELVQHGHHAIIETGAGDGAGYTDEHSRQAGVLAA
jgi:alanine dehydrogenase